MAKFQASDPDLGAYVTHYPPEKYQEFDAKVYLDKDGSAGYAIKPDGELISVFSLKRGQGDRLMRSAIANGATHCDCFDGYLAEKFYPAYGFRETERVAWDDQYAPKGWNYKRFGRPTLVFLSRKGDGMEEDKDKAAERPPSDSKSPPGEEYNLGTAEFQEAGRRWVEFMLGDQEKPG